MQEIARSEDRAIAIYTRIINGFLTDEVIVLNSPNSDYDDIYYQGATYSKEDLANMPDLGEALANMDLSQMQPPNIEIEEDMQFVSSIAMGIYRKAGDQVYGVVRVRWHYERIRPGRLNEWIRDECYYLYDQEGNGTIVETAYLEEFLDDYHFHSRFPEVYGYFAVK